MTTRRPPIACDACGTPNPPGQPCPCRADAVTRRRRYVVHHNSPGFRAQRQALAVQAGHRCQDCGAPAVGWHGTAELAVPYARGGRVPTRWLCRRCNSSRRPAP